ncbi:hypothetical protein Hanom_Chr07g00607981 [Helianthus anomalus]
MLVELLINMPDMIIKDHSPTIRMYCDCECEQVECHNPRPHLGSERREPVKRNRCLLSAQRKIFSLGL